MKKIKLKTQIPGQNSESTLHTAFFSRFLYKKSGTKLLKNLSFILFLFFSLSIVSQKTIKEISPETTKAKHPFGKGKKNAKVYHIDAHSLLSMENENYMRFVRRAIKEANENNADLIILEIDTPGGQMLPTFDISNYLINKTQPKTIAFVNNHAISAGSLLALSCDKIVMAPGGQIGDATPVLATGSYAPKKIITPAKKQWRSAAEAKGHDPDIAEQMVVRKEIIVYPNGKKEIIITNKKKILQGLSLDRNFFLQKISNLTTQQIPPSDKNKKIKKPGLPFNLDKLKNKNNTKNQQPSANAAKFEYEALSLSSKQAYKNGIAEYLAKSVREILTKEGYVDPQIIHIKPGFIEKAATFVTNPLITGFLLLIGFTGLFIEVKTPGWGVGGSVALIFLFIYFFSRVVIGMSDWGAPALAVVGLLLLALEIFVIPGFGFAGIAGMFSVISAILWAYGLSNWQEGIFILFASLSIAIFLVIFLIRHLDTAPGFNKLVLFASVPESHQLYEGIQEENTLIGKKAEALTNLRPSGLVLIDGKRVDAVSEGDFINKKEKLEVVRMEGHRIVVKKI